MVQFYIYNEVENSVLTASSENASFPLENLKDDRRTKVYRSLSNTDSIVLDMGGFRPIDSFMLVDHTLHGFNLSTLTLELNSVNNWVSPIVSVPVSIDYDNGIAKYQFTTPITCRYARLVMTSTTGFCELSKFFLGAKTSYDYVDFSYPLNFKLDNLSIVSKNRYGQKFIDEIATQRVLKAGIDYIPKDNIDDVLNWLGLVSNTRPFFINFENGQLSNDLNKFNGYYYLASEPALNFTSGNFWSLDLTLEEAN